MRIHTNAAIALAVIALAGCSTSMTKDKMMAPEAPAVSETVAAPAPASNANPAMTKCLESGGSIVQWATDGDPVDACRTSEGNEYSLDTAAFFEN